MSQKYEANFIFLCLCSFGLSIADGVSSIALVFIIYKYTHSVQSMMITFSLKTFPVVLVPFVTTILDKYNKRFFIAASMVLNTLVLLIIFLMLCFSHVNKYDFYILGMIYGLLSTVYISGFSGLTPYIIRTKNLISENAIINFIERTSYFFTYAVGGIFIISVGYKYGLLIEAIILFLIVLVFLSIKINWTVSQVNSNVFQGMGDGIKYILSHPIIRRIFIMNFLLDFIGGPLWVIIPYYLIQVRFGSLFYTVILSANLAGSVLMTLVFNIFNKIDLCRFLFVSWLGMSIFTMMYGLLINKISWALISFFIGAFAAYIGLTETVLLQKLTKKDFRMRVIGSFEPVCTVSAPIGLLIVQHFIVHVSIMEIFFIFSMICALYCISMFIKPFNINFGAEVQS